MPGEHWKDQPDDHDYPDAASYLSLLMDPKSAGALVDSLRRRNSGI